MHKCGDCFHFEYCKKYVTKDETFPEVKGGCGCFKRKRNYNKLKCIYRKKIKNTLSDRFVCLRTNKVKTDNACRNCDYFYPTLMSRILKWFRGWIK